MTTSILKIRTMSTLRVALAQLAIDENKTTNIQKAISFTKKAKNQHADVIIYPECFNCPYGLKYFAKYAESIPSGETCSIISELAKELKIHIIAGTIPEQDGNNLYNTCAIWDIEGQLVAKHRKVHLFDINIPGKIKFMESEVLSPGNTLTTVNIKNWKIGIGICYDIRFEEMARLYRKKGPLHWELLQRARANDNQCYVVCVSSARNTEASYIAWGHSQITSPFGEVIQDLGITENMAVIEIDSSLVEKVRNEIPIFKQRRTDIYDTIYKHNK
ncbi:omega-amidase NIT2 isoform X2 [Chelonus insularis]|uniref:omega-amidase NIT2 isoform X2 n=1 Tax=Chelonus insularis TaxID=460826 RepID=UPI00158C0914|nr:omega-amidase NIT2 isoform X2 [Chelonus insularis]